MIVVNLAVFKRNKILVVRNRIGDFWTLPGGKIEDKDKTLEIALERELSEELPRLKWKNARYFGEFFGITPHSREFLIVKLFLGELVGGTIDPGMEVTQARWINEKSDARLNKTMKIILHQAFLNRP